MNFNVQVDEVEMEEQAFLLELVSNILKLSYTLCCEEKLFKILGSSCEGCKMNFPSQKDHLCLMYEEEEVWNLYYDEAIQTVDWNQVWDLASRVCQVLDFHLHPSWQEYITEFYKLPWTTIYLTLLQLNICSRSGPEREEITTREGEIMQVLTKGPMNINHRRKPMLKASKVSCPEEFRRKNIERMDCD